MGFSIRKCTNKYLVFYLHKEVMPSDDIDDKESNVYWICYDEYMHPIGFCGCRPLKYDPSTLYLSSAGVLSKYNGMGLHKRLINVRLRYAKRKKFKKVITYTSKDNFQSYSNLQKCGFKLYEPADRYAGDDFLYWIRYIDG